MALLLSRRKTPQFKWRPQTFEQGVSFTLPAPYGGINLRDDITALKPNEARVLENWVATTGQLAFRDGHTFHAGGMGTGEVETLAAFVGYSASKLIAGANGKLYDATDGTTENGNDSFTKVLLHFDGSDAGTTITDSNAGGSSHTWTVAGNANTDDAQKKFGLTSLACDGTGDWVTTSDSSDFTLGSSDFTIDVQVRPSADDTQLRIAGQADSTLAAASSAWYIERQADNTIKAAVSNGTAFTELESTSTVLAGAFTHIALEREGNTLSLAIDGDVEDTAAFADTVQDSAEDLRVGAAGEATTNPWNGWLDEFAMRVGDARWSGADFTAPTLPHAPLELATGFTEDRWQTAVYGDRLFFVNGTDNPQVYNGTSVSDIAWAGSGLTDNNLINIALVRNRLWFCEKNQAWVWYGGIGQITAASNLTKFDLSQIAGGGFCMAIGSWSVTDAGDGADDLTVFVMSTGEIIVYQGDPATTFSKVGSYMGAPPIGRQCLVKVGGELIIITELGYLPVSASVRRKAGQALDFSGINPWGKIAPGVAADAELDASNAGWHGCLHLGFFYGNVPQTVGSLSKQWVLNTHTGAWTTFTKLNGSSFTSFDGGLYFGSMTDGNVFQLDGATDNGDPIVTRANGAFVYPRAARYGNVYTAARPIIQAEGTVSGVIGVDTDFVLRPLTGDQENLSENTGGTPWGSAWGSAWSTSSDPVNLWFSIEGEGSAVSVKLSAQASTSQVRWYSTDILYKPGGLRAP